MMDTTSDMQRPDAKRRLQASREALLHQLIPTTKPRFGRSSRVETLKSNFSIPNKVNNDTGDRTESGSRASKLNGTLSLLRHSLRAWWEFHPARAVVAVAQPVVAEYAERRPWKLVGIAAGVGATIVVTRPWRLISLGGLAVAALKSSHVTNAALSLLSARGATRPPSKYGAS